MKLKLVYILLSACLLLWSCKPVDTALPNLPATMKPAGTTSQPLPFATAAQPAITPSGTAKSSPATPSSPPSIERTPDPAGEMLVTGRVTAVLAGGIQVKDDTLGKELIITMLGRAEYAGGVSREFKVGNTVRIITSNRLAKTLPERAAAIFVLENTNQ